ncbi:MAG: hypothetical protein AB7O26_10945 [Planctomycetaceae bacterium]
MMRKQVSLILLEMAVMAGLAFAAAATIIPLSVVLLIIALCTAFEFFCVRWKSNRRSGAVVHGLASIAAIALTLAAAHLYRPAKVIEQKLDQSVTLHKREMSLERLAFEASAEPDRFGGRIQFTFAAADKDIVVRWPAETMTLREFVAAIESQTPLRHRFGHCGNGATILYGGNCVFGLWIREPALMGPDPARKIYDGGSYIPPEELRM